MARTAEIRETIAEVIADRKRRRSPGLAFAQACQAEGTTASVEYDETITDSLTNSRRKPRYPARTMFKVVDLSRDPRSRYWHETPPLPDDPAVTGADVRREVAHRFHASAVPELLSTSAWVQVPPGLWEDPQTFASFIDYRLVMRLSAAENHTIIGAEGGLLKIPGIARLTSAGRYSCTLIAACNAVEQMGATADGLIINPADYYLFLSKGTLMDELERNGVFIVRTRLMPQGTAIVGDFGHGAELFDAGRSVIRFAEPPAGTFAEPGIALTAEIRERVVVNLPTNFFVVSV
jgi:hypothetical protein